MQVSFLISVLTCVMIFSAHAKDQQALTGIPIVIDGDTIEINGKRIRLFGIDAPERRDWCYINAVRWKCYRNSKSALMKLIDDKEVRCTRRAIDRYKRTVSICYRGKTDLGAEMVKQGWAIAYRAYSNKYVTQERAAKAARLGIWRH